MSTFLMSMAPGVIAAAVIAVIMVGFVVYEIKKEEKPKDGMQHQVVRLADKFFCGIGRFIQKAVDGDVIAIQWLRLC